MVSIENLKKIVIEKGEVNTKDAKEELNLPLHTIELWAQMIVDDDKNFEFKNGILRGKITGKKLEEGEIYLEREEKKKDIYTYLNDSEYQKNFLVTRTNPEKLKKELKLKNTEIVWVSNVEKEKGALGPESLVEIQKQIENHISDKFKSLIIIESINYLIEYNDFEEVIKMIQNFHDMISTTNNTIIMLANFDALEKKQLAMLKEECKNFYE